MSYINKYLRNFKPYKVASHKVWTVDPAERTSILKLDWNEATYEPSPVVKERLKKLLETDFLNLYPATYNAELHQLLSDYVGLPKDNIQYFASSDSLHEYISKLYITVGDPALILWPGYDNFRLTAQVAGAHVMFFELNDDFSFDAEAFEAKIERKQPSLVYICNPNNPTGLLLEKDYICYLLKKFDTTMFLIDEAYIEFDADKTCKDLVLEYENILISRTMSKAFGMAALRLGFLIGCASTIARIRPYKVPYNVNSLTQMIGKIVLHHQEEMKDNITNIIKERERMYKQIQSMSLTNVQFFSSHANYLYGTSNNKQTFLQALKEKRIIIRDYADSDAFRITIGTQKDNTQVLSIIQSVFEKEGSICAPQR